MGKQFSRRFNHHYACSYLEISTMNKVDFIQIRVTVTKIMHSAKSLTTSKSKNNCCSLSQLSAPNYTSFGITIAVLLFFFHYYHLFFIIKQAILINFSICKKVKIEFSTSLDSFIYSSAITLNQHLFWARGGIFSLIFISRSKNSKNL